MSNAKDPTPAEVWATLSTVNVNEHKKQKMGLSYLSWAWAWQVMKEHYPDFKVHWHGDGTYPDVIYYADQSAMVSCTVTIGEHVLENAWLPVMDHKNKAIRTPDTRQINDAKMRCLVKCFALLGLGVYIYAGEDLPSEEAAENIRIESMLDLQVEEVAVLANAIVAQGVEISDAIKKSVRTAVKNRDSAALAAVKTQLENL